jgi:purine/pyrimidine-nucleoside phosphorylase
MKHNTYFDGKVQSLGVNTPQGYATVGVMEPGQYTFKTDCEEHIIVIAGSMKVKLPDGQSRQASAKDEFIVPPNVSFQVDASADVAYICYYKR